MNPSLLRWVLDPRTSLLARRIRKNRDHEMSPDTAWRLARLRLHPDEVPYRNHGHGPPS
ncbi:hypothetical protein ACFU53_03100 [Streptomyces sp. NPDC057474]|uniref:hypothetical protein n=1 Tax=Streptomyces sp. NPDC057474 TaxID=3346144 RepID=UPI0036819537